MLVITGAKFTVKVKAWFAAVPTPLLAVNVMEYVPPVPDAGVPLRVPVPLPLFLNVTPLGSAPVSVSDGVGVPVAVTANVPAAPTANIVLLPLVMLGDVPPTPVAALNAATPAAQESAAPSVALAVAAPAVPWI
jgi:hypothetical protein